MFNCELPLGRLSPIWNVKDWKGSVQTFYLEWLKEVCFPSDGLLLSHLKGGIGPCVQLLLIDIECVFDNHLIPTLPSILPLKSDLFLSNIKPKLCCPSRDGFCNCSEQLEVYFNRHLPPRDACSTLPTNLDLLYYTTLTVERVDIQTISTREEDFPLLKM